MVDDLDGDSAGGGPAQPCRQALLLGCFLTADGFDKLILFWRGGHVQNRRTAVDDGGEEIWIIFSIT